jgi:hypothetical protein
MAAAAVDEEIERRATKIDQLQVRAFWVASEGLAHVFFLASSLSCFMKLTLFLGEVVDSNFAFLFTAFY